MNQQAIDLLQDSWKKVERIAPQAAAFFYQNLFSADPSLKPLFKGDMADQGKKLMQMIGMAISTFNDQETLVPALQNLAKRHVGYGVRESQYATVGDALLKTLGQGLGGDFTPSVKQAWADAYGLMAAVMIAAAQS
ncbi:MAG: hemin receptor [Candidatus Competibacteraceae bacterium]|nr:hemin receptor [Candidatus Competibacteraceae bacterium]MBK7985236.1 hemin receptor [Candidatus Competibacteraceae bacterium]MBK8895688.1 hemin receptor [Candidatus Competibacteraceae bacterium]MBK8962780.1 hemin receptor [Candidatus Competibacteraceae bacterium]MBK9953288.1 hemin receptor [Candidatus Competibacteraceae bacterium]